MQIEIIVTNPNEAVLAAQYGATRLELIHDFELGGLTANLNCIRDVCSIVDIPVNVMVRPHGNSFIFNEFDMLQVMREIEFIITKTNASGIVFGTLNHDRTINLTQLECVLSAIKKSQLSLTFHRAIDESNDVIQSLTELMNYSNETKLNRVLTSGGKASAIDGMEKILLMREMSESSAISIIAGSGINPVNARSLVDYTGVNEIHLGTGVRHNCELDELLFKQLLTELK